MSATPTPRSDSRSTPGPIGSRVTSNDVLSIAGLLATGLLAGLSAPFMRAAAQRAIAPLQWTLLTSAIAASFLVIATLARRAKLGATWRHLAFYAAAGLFSIALPNVLLFTVARALGAATASLAYTLPPAMTVALALVTGIERPTARRVAGLTIGLAGTLCAVLPGKALPASVPWSSATLLFLVPLSIAIGNMIRARYWPAGSDALANAAGTTTAGAAWLACALIASAPQTSTALDASIVSRLAVPQGAAYALSMVLFFWLQRRAGAVFTSQVGYVATITGLVAAAVAFGERLTFWAWGAVAVVALGAATSSRRSPGPTADTRRTPARRRWPGRGRSPGSTSRG